MKSAKRERKYRKRLDTILNFYKKLIQLRKKLPVIANGTIQFLDEESEGVIGYVRELEGTKLVVLCNLCEEENKVVWQSEWDLSLIHISEPTRHVQQSRMPSSA